MIKVTIFSYCTSLFLFFSGAADAAKPDLVLAKFYKDNIQVEKYLVSEKLDGVRAFWDGYHLYTRNGIKINAPDWFIRPFPKIKLDGELWIDRGKFDAISALIRQKVSKQNHEKWKNVHYMLFELPEHPETFEKRYQRLLKITQEKNIPWLKVIPQFNVKTKQELQQKLNEVVQNNGEGLMLHLRDASYITGRSDVLLKLKPWHQAQAQVLGYAEGQGKNKGKMGALKVKDSAGNIFWVGSGFTEQERAHPPEIGSIIRYRFREYTGNQKPRFPIYVRENGEKK